MRFDTYEQMIQVAVRGQGVAMGIGRLVSGLMAAGELVAPFGESNEGNRAYFILCSTFTRDRPQVQAFVTWLLEEAKTALGRRG
jgi:LysR family glycine cleavage system transcriptional activator